MKFYKFLYFLYQLDFFKDNDFSTKVGNSNVIRINMVKKHLVKVNKLYFYKPKNYSWKLILYF